MASAESNAFGTVRPSAALRNIKISLKRLRGEDFSDAVAFSEYETIRKMLRDSPFSELRKSCTALIRAVEEAEEEPPSETGAVSPIVEKLTGKYKVFISSLEKLDSTASLAVRGRTIAKDELEHMYSNTVGALQEFFDQVQQSLAASTESPIEA
jgi:hypothetical protein